MGALFVIGDSDRVETLTQILDLRPERVVAGFQSTILFRLRGHALFQAADVTDPAVSEPEFELQGHQQMAQGGLVDLAHHIGLLLGPESLRPCEDGVRLFGIEALRGSSQDPRKPWRDRGGREAFAAAADPNRFPEQIDEGLRP